MITNNLKNKILIEPARKFDKLYIVSGYATSELAEELLRNYEKNYPDRKYQIHLIIGMGSTENHHRLLDLKEDEFPNQLYCYYANEQVHSKVYTWVNSNEALGFSGSANFTSPAFNCNRQKNQMTITDGKETKKYFDKMLSKSKPISRDDIKEYKTTPRRSEKNNNDGKSIKIDEDTYLISFLDKNGNLPEKSGFNHGHSDAPKSVSKSGKKQGRNIKDAYLVLRARPDDSRKRGFLPFAKKEVNPFTLLTDDNRSFTCKAAGVAKARGGIEVPKQIQSAHNPELGIYLRERMGLALNKKVTIEDLRAYGRTDYELKKIDENTFLFNFDANK